MFGKEDFAVVLDFLPHGKAGEAKQEPIVQAVGERFFTLLDLVAKPGLQIVIGERVYIGRDQRDKVERIRGRVMFNDLTSAAQRELETTVRKIIVAREKEFVNFINTAGAITIRAHALEHLPSIGKKHLESILDERKRKPFESFDDIQKRVPHLGNPLDIFAERIMLELKGGEKYYLFVKKPVSETEEDRRYR